MDHDQMEFNPQQEQAVQQPNTGAQSAQDQEVNDTVYFLELLKHLRATVERANRIPMSGLAVINVATFMQIIDELDRNLPDAIQHGMQMYSEKSRIMGEAESTAISRVTTAEMKANKALEKARREADQIIQDAHDEAAGILDDADERARFMISESEIMKQAREEARSIKNDARIAANELSYKASHDVQRMMTNVEECLNQTLKEIRNLHSVIAKDEE